MKDGPELTLNDWLTVEEAPPEPQPLDLSFPEWIMEGVAGDFGAGFGEGVEDG